MREPKVISLYSFKGGAGRTLCTANLVGLLAREIGASEASPILLLDMDLDSAGLTILLEQTDAFEGKRWNLSNILNGKFSFRDTDNLSQLKARGVQDVSARVDAPKGSVLFIGAEPVGHEISEARKGIMDDQMVELLEYCGLQGISTLVIDCASGLQQIANLTRRFSDVIIYCSRLTNQFLWGTTRELKIFVSDCQREGSGIPSIVLLPVAVPKSRDDFKECFDASMMELRRLEMDLQDTTGTYLHESGVCEVESFKWVETVLSLRAAVDAEKTALSADEESALGSFRQLAKKVKELAKLD